MDDYRSWRDKFRIIDDVLTQEGRGDICWIIAITRQLCALGRLKGLLHPFESLSIQYIINEAHTQHVLNVTGELDGLEKAKNLFVNGTILDYLCPLTNGIPFENGRPSETQTKFKALDLVVHKCEVNIEQFENKLREHLRYSPVAVAVPCYESLQNVGNGIYFPTWDEQKNMVYDTYHVMLASGFGTENHASYLEVQDSGGTNRGEKGFFKIGLGRGILSHFVELIGFSCSPERQSPGMSSNSMTKFHYHCSIFASKAHATMLAAKELITAEEKDLILGGLANIERDIVLNTLAINENVQETIQSALHRISPIAAKKLDRGRSKSDQIATDFRLWCCEAIQEVVVKIRHFQIFLTELAWQNKTSIIPSDDPILLPQLLLAYIERLNRDVDRYNDCRRRLNFCPLGGFALAGSHLPFDRSMTAKDLGFTGPIINSIDAISDVDFVLEFLAAISLTETHLSQFIKDLQWASLQPGFLTISGSVSPSQRIHDVISGVSLVRDLMNIAHMNTAQMSYEISPSNHNEYFRAICNKCVSEICGMIDSSLEVMEHARFNQIAIKKKSAHISVARLLSYLVNTGRFPDRYILDGVDDIVDAYNSQDIKLETVSLENFTQKWAGFKDLSEYSLAPDYASVESQIKECRSKLDDSRSLIQTI